MTRPFIGTSFPCPECIKLNENQNMLITVCTKAHNRIINKHQRQPNSLYFNYFAKQRGYVTISYVPSKTFLDTCKDKADFIIQAINNFKQTKLYKMYKALGVF